MASLAKIMNSFKPENCLQSLLPASMCANDFDWGLIMRNAADVPGLFSGLEAPDKPSEGDPPTGYSAAAELGQTGIFAGLDPAERREAIVKQIGDSVEGVVGKKVGPNEPLMDSGLDSLGAVELSNAIAKAVGLELSSTFTIDYPTISAMVEYVDSTYEVQPGRDLASLTTSLDAGRGVPHRNAFFGRMSANTLEEQTTVLLKDNVSRVPYERWDFSYIDSIEDAVGAPRFGIFMDDVSKFDPRGFNIMPAEAVYTDPQQRILLLHSSKILSGVSEKGVGSYVSFVSSDYSTLASAHDVPVNAFSFSGTASSVASGRISFCFGLKGPAMSVDVACAGSLVTAHAAHTSIRAGVVGSCITGGVMLNLVWSTTFILHQGGFLAADGRCKTMDAEADGYARGEACRVLLLHSKEGTGDVMLAGTAANHSGTCSTLTAPNGPSQQSVIHQALFQSAGLAPRSVHALQMHANATSLGDPIEIGASIGVLQEGRGDCNPLMLLSQKGRTGHQEAAAGAVLMTAAWSAAMSQSAASFLHLRLLNPFVATQFDKAAVQVAVPRCMQRMGPARKDIAIGVSAFAAQGTNAHVVLAGDIVGPHSDLKSDLTSSLRLKRYWITPPSNPLIYRNVACVSNRWMRQAKMVLEGRMALREMAPFWQISLGNRVIVPSGMLLFAGAAAVNACTDTVAARPVGVQEAMFCNPVTLPQRIPEDGESIRILMSLSSTGKLLGTVENGGDNEHGDPRRMEREDIVAQVSMCPFQKNLRGRSQEQADDLAQPLWLRSESDSSAVAVTEGAVCRSFDGVLGAIGGSLTCGAEASGDQVPLLSTVEHIVLPHVTRWADGSERFRVTSNLARQALEGQDMGSVTSMRLQSTARAGVICEARGIESKNIFHGVAGRSDDLASQPETAPSSVSAEVLRLFQEVEMVRVKSVSSSEVTEGVESDRFRPSEPTHTALGGVDMDPEELTPEEQLNSLRTLIKDEVRGLVGYTPADDEPLMASGLDSRSAMELRGMLNRNLEVKLPATLLYDCQTVDAIAEAVIDLEGEKKKNAPRGSSNGKERSSQGIDKEKLELAVNPTPTVKTLRGSVHRPLFLAAPGVANGQSAYFSFMSHLAYCDQPIYTLEKDNAFTIAELAARHVEDILKIQPFGPYLIGGHSYGGVVAIETAIQLEQAGREIGAVFCFDAPHPCQIRGAIQNSMADDRDAIELMEMILEAIDFGLERGGWPDMNIMEKYAYFAPVYRVMRDENFTVAQVREQVLAIADAIKRGDQPSDMRHHNFPGRLNTGQVYFFRAHDRGAVAYVQDQDDVFFSHGVGYKDIVSDLTVLDVPGDHFSMLRQSPRDMDFVQSTMKQVLYDFGWSELKGHDDKPFKLSEDDAREMEEYLSKMGIKRENISDSLKKEMPWAFGDATFGASDFGGSRSDSDDEDPRSVVTNVFDVVLEAPSEPLLAKEVDVVHINSTIHEDAIPVFFFHDITGSIEYARPLAEYMDMPCFGVKMPDVRRLGTIESLEHLVETYVEAVKAKHPHGPYIFSGCGFGCQLAYEAACQLGEQQVSGVLIFDGQITLPELQRDVVWCALYSVVAPQVTVGEFVAEMQSHEAFDEQLDFLGGYCPGNFERKEWDAVINSTLLQAHFCALAAEQYDPQKLYSGPAFMLSSQDNPAADAAEIDARSFMIKLVATTHAGLDAPNAAATSAVMKSCIANGLEAWEDMALKESECRLSESRALMRSLGDPGRSEGVPYVESWISSGMPTTSTSEWSTSPANSALILEKVDRLISEMNSEHEALEEGKRELGEAGPSGERREDSGEDA
jgi:thioesterase domain-containing protein/3-oxoacyl-(acyl-carrier-protein) synthase/acyl carrier protein